MERTEWVFFSSLFFFFLFILGVDWFETIRKALCPKIDELKQLCLQLHLNAAVLLEYISLVLDDEAMLGYQPSKKKVFHLISI